MQTITYINSLLTFYIKGEITTEQNFVKFKMPNTILGLIPLGAKKDSVPIRQLASVSSNFKVKFLRLVVGVVLAILGLSMFKETFIGGLIILLIGANVVISSFETILLIQTTAGASKAISFFIFEKSKAVTAEEEINRLISAHDDDRNVRQQAEWSAQQSAMQTDRIIEAINRDKE